ADDLLGKALADAQRALAIDALPPQAPMEISRIYRQRGEARERRDQDPSDELKKAVEAAAAILPGDRDVSYDGNLGLIYMIWADHEDQVGADSRVHRGQAIDAYARAIAQNDKMIDVWINLGISYFKRASLPHGDNPDGDLLQAIHALDAARTINPRHVVPFCYLVH